LINNPEEQLTQDESDSKEWFIEEHNNQESLCFFSDIFCFREKMSLGFYNQKAGEERKPQPCNKKRTYQCDLHG